MTRIISIVWYKVLPPKFGGQKGIANFNKYLSKQYSLVCLCSKNNEPADDIPYKVLPDLPVSKWQFLNPFCWKKIKDGAKKEKATHIILEHPYHGIAACKAKKSTGAKLILHSHNIESERFRRTGKWWWRLLRRYEKWVHREADLLLFKTGSDKNFAINYFEVDPDKCIIIPYGIEQTVLPDRSVAGQLLRQRHNIKTEDKILLFGGTRDYEPNAKAVEKIYTEIAPQLASDNFPFKIIICGRNKEPSFQYLEKLSHPYVIAAGEVGDMEYYFAAASVFINPVQHGGGIQVKNIDALAHHCNLVCFENMIEKETVAVARDKVFTASQEDWPAFIQQIKKAASYTGETPPSFFEHYDWAHSIARLMDRINTI